jgi:hypothetical protein
MRACDGGRRRVALGVIALAAGLALGSAGHAQEKGSIHFEMIVSHVSPEPGSIDPRAEELHRQIKGEIRYRSLRVIELRTFDLDLDEVGSLELPTGRKVRVRPLAVAESEDGPAGPESAHRRDRRPAPRRRSPRDLVGAPLLIPAGWSQRRPNRL